MTWIHDAVFSTDLFPYTVRREFNKVMLPLTEEGLFDEDADSNGYWINAESVYEDNKGDLSGMVDSIA